MVKAIVHHYMYTKHTIAMKKSKLTCGLIVLCLFLFAKQGDAQRRFEGAAIAGFNLSQVDGDLLDGYNKPGVNVGARVDAILTDRWQVGLEFLFVQQGASRNNNDNLASRFDKIRLNMVEVPVLVHFRDWKMEVSAGGSYGRIINYEIIDVLGEDISEQVPLSADVFSVVLDGSFHFTDNWALNIRWSRWLNNIREDEIMVVQGGESGKFIGKNVTVRGIYTF
jgi:hypothetical protein